MSYYNFITNDHDNTADLYIDGEISCEHDWWDSNGKIVARDFRQRLSRCGDVVVYINSPGGDVFAGAELYSALREHAGNVTVKVTGIAASAASLVAMAGDTVLMSPVAYMMIHDPWTYVAGNARDMEREAAILREIGEGLAAAYVAKTGKPRDEIASMLAAETYMNAQRCVDEGFADGILYEAVAAPGKNTALASNAMQANQYTAKKILALASEHVKPRHSHSLPPHTHSTPSTPPTNNAAMRKETAQWAALIASLYPEAQI